MNVDILVVSSLYDFSTDLVVQELERLGEKYVRLNREEFKDYRLTLDAIGKCMVIKTGNGNYNVTSRLKAIYYRQPVFLRNTPGESLSIDEQLIRSQWMGFLRSLAVFNSARWLNPLDATYLAETKAYQLTVAQSVGFKVPKTLIGNDSEEFHSFNQEVIIKSLDTVLLREGDDCLFTYSTLKHSGEMNDDNVSAAPLTVQEYITPKIDIRVTIIGSKLVAVKITSNGCGIEEDWRTINRDSVEYSEIELPGCVADCCLKLMKRLNLNFGAIDLIKCGKDYYFIEVNPTGEWGWLVCSERRFDIDIAAWLANVK